MEKRTFRENSVIFEPTQDRAIDQGEVFIEKPGNLEKPALPNQIPKTLNLQQMPEAILKSGAVNALIQQNEDLVSRLGISLRRYSKLEEEIEDRNKRISQLVANESAYKDQVMILERKAELVDERTKDVRIQNEKLANELQLLETRYSELYSNNSSKLIKLNKQLSQERKKATRLARYRNRILKMSTEIRTEMSNLRFQIQKLEAEYAVLHESYQSLRERMTASTEHIQRKETDHQENISSLTESYEKRMNELENRLSDQMFESEGLKAELVKFATLSEEKVKSDNEVIFLKRKLSENKEDHEVQLTEIQKDLVKFRTENKQRTIENQEYTQKNERLENENALHIERIKNLEDQVESLQMVWNSGHLDLEKEKQKNDSLQKLNQQISLTLNESRQEMNKIKQEKESNRVQYLQSVAQLETQIKALNKELLNRTSDTGAADKLQSDDFKQIEDLVSKTINDLTNI